MGEQISSLNQMPSPERGGVEVMSANPADAEQIQRFLQENSHTEQFSQDAQDEPKNMYTEAELSKLRVEMTNELEGHRRMIVAKKGGSIVGVCRLAMHGGRNYVQGFYVSPEHLENVGSALWDETQNYFKQDRSTIVEVGAEDQRTKDFFVRRGFSGSGITDDEHSYQMMATARGGVV